MTVNNPMSWVTRLKVISRVQDCFSWCPVLTASLLWIWGLYLLMCPHKRSGLNNYLLFVKIKRIQILSRDSVTVTVDAVVNFNVYDAALALCSVDDFRYRPCITISITHPIFSHSTRLLAATTLRNVLGTKLLSEILSEREGISKLIKVSRPSS